MKHPFLWQEQGYCSSLLKNIQLQTKSSMLEIPISEKVSEYEICRFKLIFEEVENEQQLLLGSAVLGEKIAERNYETVCFLEDDVMYYTHENDLTIINQSENETIQQAVKGGLIHESMFCQKECLKLVGEYEIKIAVFRQEISQPRFLSSEAPQHVTDYEQKIETITVYVRAYKHGMDTTKNNELTNTSVYGSLGSLGFFMVDLPKFSELIRNECGNEPLNLVDVFTTTDLVDKCFEHGILIITWGIKPWHYYIQSMNHSVIVDECIICGTYKIKQDIKELSVIPGDELLTWPACLDKSWPTVRLEGTGEKVNLALHSWSGALGNEFIPVYIVQRSEEEVEMVEPIINYSCF